MIRTLPKTVSHFIYGIGIIAAMIALGANAGPTGKLILLPFEIGAVIFLAQAWWRRQVDKTTMHWRS